MAAKKTHSKKSPGSKAGAAKMSPKTTAKKKSAAARGKEKAAITAGMSSSATYIGTVKSESATSVHLFVNGSEISLDRDGDTFSGQESIAASATVTVEFDVTGLNGTDWSVEVDVDCPNSDPAKVLSKKGTVGKPDGLGFTTTASVQACS